ncbi:FAD linked oxidase domain-containing protein [Salinisphaera sp. T5B8]|uniref:FAD-binding oxidoreductase n=1 Tax=Salinisphaera sp. T5B8 TaxID=1304154 RepID=UPI003342B522
MSVLADLQSAFAPERVIAPEHIPVGHRSDWGVALASDEQPAALVYAHDADDVSRALEICARHACPVVTQGGLTGLTGAATPSHGCVIVSLERMRTIEEIDTAAATMTVEAGVALERVQQAAAEAGLFFPLDLGARGSCQIGGNIATNAGGNRVLRYGMARDLVLGLEVVLADGSVVTSLNKMQKNNAGYDIKHLFIGSEGTLGIITRAVLRLFPATTSESTALCAVSDYDALLAFLAHAKARLGPTLSAFEVMWPDFYRLALGAHDMRPPLDDKHSAYVLLDTLGTDAEADQTRFEETIASALSEGLITDAVLAQSLNDSERLWRLRGLAGEFSRVFSPRIDFDISVPIGDIGVFLERAYAALTVQWPAARILSWGHIADSNVHLSVSIDEQPQPLEAVERVVYGLVREYGGSISAEHGIGLLKKPFLDYSRSPAEIALMQRMKHALDPAGLLNPGKVI